MSDYDCIVIGGGLLGVASANLIAQSGKSVAVIERHGQLGTETSSRNSGVIHAGLYYPPGSLKAATCAEGRRLLYERCSRHHIAHQRTGKLVVATETHELERLEALLARAQENGAGAVRLIDTRKARELEPHVQCAGGLLSPETGVVDVHELLYSHKKEAADEGVDFTFHTEVEGLSRHESKWKIACRTTHDRFTVSSQVLVNAAGLMASEIARLAGVDVEAEKLQYHWCKGDYFSLSSRHRGRIRRLVYPLPSHAGLGVHLTLDLTGQVVAGPDTEYVNELNYDVKETKRAAFVEAIARYYPDIREQDLTPAYSGIRPKLQGPNDEFRDFVIEDLTDKGAPRMIALLGIESPGVTASESVAQRVSALVERAMS